MTRGTTARTVVSILAAVLLALQFFAPAAIFTSAHTPGNAMAKNVPGTKPSGKTLRDEIAARRDAGHIGDPTGPLPTVDRHRTADVVRARTERVLPGQTPPAAREPVPADAAHQRTSRCSAAHSPAALQVFRC
ncbi:hypothetical protein [Streptomyces sp. TRM68367]|uniref:hypothetical protein n=1 Tax=Streptomyces sp. TRM68367 TaxID=2758415 RepID=UPI00165BA0A4|nr:hypothetical protein [Streptomyces sp. TRM68367]MBC9726277.1 hypothetical protein [Streptomyces sp. TRM68367]